MSADKFYDLTLNQFIELAAAPDHQAGGATVGAVAAALGASMVAKVAGLTMGNPKYAQDHDQARDCHQQVMAVIARLKELTSSDSAAFDGFMAALRLPKGTDAQKAARLTAMQESLQAATLLPLEMCGLCLKVMQHAQELAGYGSPMAISEVGVGVEVCWAALRSCLLNVDFNLAAIKDQSFVLKIKRQCDAMLDQGRQCRQEALALVAKKIA